MEMYHFPHTYFDPRHGAVQMNPFFKKGIKSSTIFVYDFVNQKKWVDARLVQNRAIQMCSTN